MISMKRWRAMLDASVELYELGDVQAIDATGVNRVQASHHYAERTDYTFEAVKPRYSSIVKRVQSSTYNVR